MLHSSAGAPRAHRCDGQMQQSCRAGRPIGAPLHHQMPAATPLARRMRVSFARTGVARAAAACIRAQLHRMKTAATRKCSRTAERAECYTCSCFVGCKKVQAGRRRVIGTDGLSMLERATCAVGACNCAQPHRVQMDVMRRRSKAAVRA